MSIKLSIFIPFIIIILIGIVLLLNAQPQQKLSEPIILQYADSLVGTTVQDLVKKKYSGNVQFRQGKVILYCDEALQFVNENRAEMRGNVRIIQEDLLLKAPFINYDGNSGIADANYGVSIRDKNATLTSDSGIYSTRTYIADFLGHVKIVDTSSTIIAEHIQYDRKNRESIAEKNVLIEDDSIQIYCDWVKHEHITRESHAIGNVFIRGKYTNAMLSGDTVLNIYTEQYTRASGNPVLIQIDTNIISRNVPIAKDTSVVFPDMSQIETDSVVFDTLTISSKIMEAYRNSENEKYIFRDSVEILKGKVSAKAMLAVYYKKEQYITLSGTPVVWYDSTQMHSDSINIFLNDKKLSLIHSIGNALSAARDDTTYLDRITQISGDQIKLSFRNDSILSVTSIGNAKSLYFLKTDTLGNGSSRHSSDSIIITFSVGEPDYIKWYGEVQGEYFPENIIAPSPKNYYLPSFRWSDEKPKRKNIKIRQ